LKLPPPLARSELTSKSLITVSRPAVMMNDSSSKVSESSTDDPVPIKAYLTETKVPSVKASVEKLVPSDVIKSLAVQQSSDTKNVSTKVISRTSADLSSSVRDHQ
jgi:hypothetical protein